MTFSFLDSYVFLFFSLWQKELVEGQMWARLGGEKIATLQTAEEAVTKLNKINKIYILAFNLVSVTRPDGPPP